MTIKLKTNIMIPVKTNGRNKWFAIKKLVYRKVQLPIAAHIRINR